MLYLYTGKVGEGKTHHVVRTEIVPAVKNGRKIYTNIDCLDSRAISLYTGVPLDKINIVVWETTSQIIEAMQLLEDDKEGHALMIERGSLIVIDEAQMVWDAREFKNTRKDFLRLLEYHRHFGLDVVMITQAAKRLDSAVVRLSNQYLNIRRLGFLSGALASGYLVQMRDHPTGPIVSTGNYKLDPHVFLLYRSTSLHVNSTLRGAGALSRGLVYFGVFFACFIAWFSISGRKSRGFVGETIGGKNGIISVSSSSVHSPLGPDTLRDSLSSVNRGVTPTAPIIAVGDSPCWRENVISKAEITMGGKTEIIMKPNIVTVCPAGWCAENPNKCVGVSVRG